MNAREREWDHSQRGSGAARHDAWLQWCLFFLFRLHDCRKTTRRRQSPPFLWPRWHSASGPSPVSSRVSGRTGPSRHQFW